MAERYIEVEEGDRVIIYAVPRASPEAPPDQSNDNLEVLLEIPPVTIYASPDGTYVHFVSDLDICNDGSGPAHGDRNYQPQTAYYNKGKYLNADVDRYMVVPPQIRSMVGPVVMGCHARVTNMQTGVVSDAVVGDIGPDNKTGECAYCLAEILNSTVTHNSGDKDRVYLYELWPGKAAEVDGKTYPLQPA